MYYNLELLVKQNVNKHQEVETMSSSVSFTYANYKKLTCYRFL